MARRQKKPTNEELIEKLQEQIDQIKADNEEKHKEILELLEMQKKQEVDFNDFKELNERNGENINQSISTQTENLGSRIENLDEKIDSITETITADQNNKFDEMKELLDQMFGNVQQKLDENSQFCIDKIQTGENTIEESKTGQNEQMDAIKQVMRDEMKGSKGLMMAEINTVKAHVDFLGNRVDEVSEKLYEFEQNKRNNLIFYGVASEPRETPAMLLDKIVSLIKFTLMLRRDIVVSKANRMYTGPEVSGCRPVVVTFEEFKDREDVLRKASMLRGTNIHVTEDMSRRVRESQSELKRFMRVVKKSNPAATCFLQYDKLYIDHKVYVFNDIQGKVVESKQEAVESSERPSSVNSISLEDRSGSSMSCLSSSFGSPTKSWRMSPTPLARTQSLNFEQVQGGQDGKDARIEELEEALMRQREVADTKIRKMEEVMEKLKQKLAQCEDIEDF